MNLVTAPELIFPISLGHLGGLEIDAGIEAGHNFKNNVNPNGFRTVFRGLSGAQFGKIFTPNGGTGALKQVKITSQYQVRLLADDEVITKALHGKLVPYVGHQARNWVSMEIDFMFTSNFGLTFKHDYGALPPGFVFVENRATVGFTVQSAQKQFAKNAAPTACIGACGSLRLLQLLPVLPETGWRRPIDTQKRILSFSARATKFRATHLLETLISPSVALGEPKHFASVSV